MVPEVLTDFAVIYGGSEKRGQDSRGSEHILGDIMVS